MSRDWRISVVGQAASTQDLAFEAADRGEPSGFVIQALQQSAARGRHGNKWEAPMGNLYFSALLRPKCTPNEAGQIAFITAIALSAAIEPYIDEGQHEKRLKWPNDILIGGLKISGILLESNIKGPEKIEYLVVGVGLNIFAPPEGAVGLDSLKTKPVYVNVFRDEFLAEFGKWLDLWEQKGFAPIREEWLKQAKGLDQEIKVRLAEETLKGVFKGIDETGALLLDRNGQIETIQAGEVYFG